MTTTRHDGRVLHTQFLDAYLDHLQHEVSERTYHDYARVLRLAHRELPYGAITATDVELRTWLAGKGNTAETRRTYRKAFAGLHRWLRRREITDHNPVDLLPSYQVPRHLPRPVPPHQLRRILTETRQPVRLWCTVAYYAAARCCEIARLDREDITPELVRLYGKGGKEAVVPTHPALWAAVQPLPPGPLAPGVTPKQLSHRVAKELDRIGLPDVTAHRLRHSLATDLLTATSDLRLVQEMLRHASPSTTAIYAMVVPARLAAAVRQLPTPGSGLAAAAAVA